MPVVESQDVFSALSTMPNALKQCTTTLLIIHSALFIILRRKHSKRSAISCLFLGIMRVHMHIPLGIRDGDALLVESFFDLFGGVEIDVPVMLCSHPGTDNEIYAAVGQFRKGLKIIIRKPAAKLDKEP